MFKMKRSEMEKIINTYIEDQVYYGYTPTGNFILDLVEEAGMLPPFTEPEQLSVMKDEKKYTMYYKWEPEDG
jgi:hypothetical protein